MDGKKYHFVHFVGDAADAAAPVDFFAFFFLAFFVPVFAGAGEVVDAEGADDAAGAVLWANATADNAAATSAASKYFMRSLDSFTELKMDTDFPCRRH